MNEPYSPIARTFCQLRAAVLRTGAVTRQQIYPDARLEDVVPVSIRAEVWNNLPLEPK
jgi:hypothetical protein